MGATVSSRAQGLLLAGVAVADVALGVWVHARWWAMLPGLAPLVGYLAALSMRPWQVRRSRAWRDEWLTGFAAATAAEARRQVPRGPGAVVMSTRMADGIVPPSAALLPGAGDTEALAYRRAAVTGKPPVDTSWVTMTGDRRAKEFAGLRQAPDQAQIAVIDARIRDLDRRLADWGVNLRGRDPRYYDRLDGVPAGYPFTDADRLWIRRHMTLAREGRITL